MALCPAVMYQSCGTCVEFRKCQCSPSVYVPCNLAVSLSWCTREQAIHQKRNIINYPSSSKVPFFPPPPSDFKIKVGKSFEVLWNAQGSQIPEFRCSACPNWVFISLEVFLLSRHWTVPESNHEFHRNCIAGKDAFLADCQVVWFNSQDLCSSLNMPALWHSSFIYVSAGVYVLIFSLSFGRGNGKVPKRHTGRKRGHLS